MTYGIHPKRITKKDSEEQLQNASVKLEVRYNNVFLCSPLLPQNTIQAFVNLFFLIPDMHQLWLYALMIFLYSSHRGKCFA